MMIAPIYNPAIAKWSKLVATSAEMKFSAMIGSIREVGIVAAHESLHAATLRN